MSLIKANKSMENLLQEVRATPAFLPGNMAEFLMAGFRKVDGAIFFYSIFDRDFLPDHEFIKNAYTDLSGYEFSVNKLHLEDCCDSECLRSGIIFANKFLSLWRGQFSESAVALLTYDKNPEFGEICTFQFHKKREGEVIIDFDKIEEFSNPVLGIDTSFGGE